MSYLAPLLGWVLLQAVWQCLAAALLLLVCLRCMRSSPAARRYRCAVLHLAGALAAVALAGAVSHASVASALADAARNAHAMRFTGAADRSQFWLQAAGWIWLISIGVFQASLTVRWVRLRRFLGSTVPAPPALTAMVEELSAAAGLYPAPVTRWADIASPMVAGRRPAYLLLPRAFEETWPLAERRALVAHELAHVLRGDYSRNLLHLSAASLLWWHPAVWLMEALIRHERECSTDELAVRLTGSAASLAKALWRLADSTAGTDWLAAAASSGSLADRLTRLACPPRSHGRGRAAAFLAGAAAALTILTVAANSSAAHREALTRAYAASAVAPPMLFTFQAHDPAGAFQVKMVRGRVLAIDLGRDPVPRARIEQRGATVRVLGEGGGELLRIEVDPRGAIRWKARQAS